MFVSPDSLYWENIPLQNADLESLPTANLIRYTASFDLACEQTAPVTATVRLPSEFDLAPDSGTIAFWDSTPMDLTTLTQTGRDVQTPVVLPACWEPVHVDIAFDVLPGFTLGTFDSDLTVSGSETVELHDTAPVTVAEDDAADTVADATLVAPNTLVVGHIASPGDVDTYAFHALPVSS